MARKRKAADCDANSDYEDASYEPRNSKEDDEDDWMPSKKGARGRGRGKRKRDASDTGFMNEPDTDLSPGPAQACPHPVSLHVLSRPEQPRKALLDWYGGVHASRGMPWRKPFDPTWSQEQKAQRAYEVNPPILTLI